MPLERVSYDPFSHGLDPYISDAAEKYDIPENRLRAVVEAESNFNPDAVSHAGAQGAMQLMPKTAADLGVTDPMDPQQNIDAGARYLKQQYDRFGDWDLAHAAYNAGPGNVQKYGGVPPFPETQGYLQKINARLGESDEPGLTKVDYDPFAETEKGLQKVDYDPFQAKSEPAPDQFLTELAQMPLAERAARLAIGLPVGAAETAIQMATQVPQMAAQVAGFAKAVMQGKMTQQDFEEATAEITPKWVSDLASAEVLKPETYAGALMTNVAGEAFHQGGRALAAPGAGLVSTIPAAIEGEGTEGARGRFEKAYEALAPVTEQTLNAAFVKQMGSSAIHATRDAIAARVALKPVEPPQSVLDATSVEDAISAATAEVQAPIRSELAAQYDHNADQRQSLISGEEPEAPADRPLIARTDRVEEPAAPETLAPVPTEGAVAESPLETRPVEQGKPEESQLAEVGAKPVESMTDHELDLASRLTRSDERRAEIQAETDRRVIPAEEPTSTTDGIRQTPEVEDTNARAVEGQPAPGIESRAETPVASGVDLRGAEGEEAARTPPVASEVPAQAVERSGFDDYSDKRGEVKQFATKALASAYAKQNGVPVRYSPRSEGRGKWLLSRPEPTPAERAVEDARKQKLSESAKARQSRIASTDEVKTIIGKAGGWSRMDALKDGVDPKDIASLSRAGAIGRPFFPKSGGMSIDGVAEVLAQHGFDVHDEDGRIDATKAREIVQESLLGNSVYSPEGQVIRASREARIAEEYKPRPAEIRMADATPAEAIDGALVARAAAIDDGAVERLSMQHENDDAAFMRGIKEFIHDHESAKAGEFGAAHSGAEEARGEAPAPEPAEKTNSALTPASAGVSSSGADYSKYAGKFVKREIPVEGGTTATMTMRADEALKDHDERIAAVEELRKCL